MASPKFRISGGAVGAKAALSAGAPFSATLDSIDGVNFTEWEIAGTDDESAIGDYALVTSGSVSQTVSSTSLANGTAGILRCTVNHGVDPTTGDPSPIMTATAKFFVPTASGLEVGAAGETFESNATTGSTGIVNAAIREVDAFASSSASAQGTHPPVKAATTANVTLSGAQTIDGVSVSGGDRVLAKNQTLGENNGIYVVGTPWTRAADANTSSLVVGQMIVSVQSGTVNGGLTFYLKTQPPITLGTTPLVFLPQQPEVDARFYATADGTTDDLAHLQSANAASATVRYTPGTYAVGSNGSIGAAHSTHRFIRGAILKPGSSKTLSLVGYVTAAPDQQAFDLTSGGDVVLDGVSNATVYPAWYGVLAGVGDVSSLIVRALNDSGDNATIAYQAGTYTLVGPITVGKSTQTHKFERGAVWSMTGTITLNGLLDAPDAVIFGGSGNITFAQSLPDGAKAVWYGANPDGSTNNNAAFTRAHTSSATVAYSPGSFALTTGSFGTANATTHRFERGALLKPGAAQVVTLHGQLEAAADQQIFDITLGGAGSILLPDVRSVRPEWFGATAGSTSIDANAAVLAAATSITSGGKTLLRGLYSLHTVLTLDTIPTGVTFEGEAGSQSILQAHASSTDSYVVSANGVSDVVFRNVVVDANQSARTLSGTASALAVIGTDTLLDRVTWMNTLGTAGASAVGCNIGGTRVEIVGCLGTDCGQLGKASDGLYISATHVQVNDYKATRCADHGLVFERASFCEVDGLIATDCGAAFGVSATGSADTDTITINNFEVVVSASPPAWVAVGFDFGTFGTTNSANLLNLKIQNGIVDQRGNAGFPALAMYSWSSLLAPAATSITNVTNATPMVVTAAGHGYSNGEVIEVFAVDGCTAANGRWMVEGVSGTTFQLYQLDGVTPSVGSGAYTASSGFTKFGGRTKGVEIRNVRILTNGALSLGVFINDCDGLEISDSNITGEDATAIDIAARCGRVIIRHNEITAGHTFGVIFSDGCYDLDFFRNQIRGTDGVTQWGIYGFGTSKRIRNQRNEISGSSLIDQEGIGSDATTAPRDASDDHYRTSVPALDSTGIWPLGSVIWNTNLSVTGTVNIANSIQGWRVTTAGIASAAVFTPIYYSRFGALGLGQAAVSTSMLGVTADANDRLIVGIVGNGGTGRSGLGWAANGEYFGLSHNIPVALGVGQVYASVRGELNISSGNYPPTMNTALYFRLNAGGSVAAVGIGVDPSGKHTHLLLPATTTTDSPIQWASGTAKTSPEDGDVELTSVGYLATYGGTRYGIPVTFGTTATVINIPVTALTTGQTVTNTGTVTGAAVGDQVLVCPASGTASDNGTVFDAWVSSANTVTVRVTCVTASITTNGVNYNVRVVKKP